MAGPSKSSWASLLKGAFNIITGNASPGQAATTTAALGSLFARRISGFGQAVRDTAWQGFRAATQAMGARGYIDGEPYNPNSSWIKALTFRPMLYRQEQYDQSVDKEVRGNRGSAGFAVPDREYGKTRVKLFDSGDLIMTTAPNKTNTSGNYTYPGVPRTLMDAWTRAPSAGQFYWKNARGGAGNDGNRMNRNGIQSYSNRAAILLGRMRKFGTAEVGINSALRPRQSPPRRR